MIRSLALLFVFVAVLNAELLYSVSSLESGNVLVTLTNNGQEAVTFLRYGTAFDSMIGAPILEVRDTVGRNAQYIGKIAKRVYPAPASAYITLAAGESISAAIDIHNHYKIHEEGEFTVTPVTPKALHGAKVAMLSKFLAKSTEKSTVKGVLASNYDNCSSDEKKLISDNLPIAKQYAKKTTKCLKDKTCSTYAQKWIGSTSGSDYNYVEKLFDVLDGDLDEINAECHSADCSSDTYAYVFPDDKSHRVHVCDFFFNTEDNSERPQTLIHETSHFNDVGNPGTDDNAYGQEDCLALAISDSSKASHNADNLGYMAVDIGVTFVDVTNSQVSNVVSNGVSNGNNSGAATIAPFVALLLVVAAMLF